ncbi:DEAD/DEAH box helicase [Thalassovita aquimarina]|uniref:DEAD/DEAH box helicase n=1 Tax=Thalassovita aquimarina TaxID=2785917 RepID=A0ABS5HYW9_9RHOB|nr:DEAD/DEAH box helicase [Thalassovita aquimarina]MBR9653583.1 DEAD/DEAH box helicase [Thalassovita aquimarina]
MFDPVTLQLMSGAPELDGINQADIPKLLTEAYAQIVAARIRLKDFGGQDPDLEALQSNIGLLSRLAATHEAFVATSRDRENRSSAAFVAGSAHHARVLYAKAIEGQKEPTQLTSHFISPEVSAALLFLTAEATADAAEMVKQFREPSEGPIEIALIRSISCLCSGDLHAVLEIVPPVGALIDGRFSEETAARALYLRLLQCVRAIAAQILQVEGAGMDEGNPTALIEQVIALCSAPLEAGIEGTTQAQSSVFSGPLHLASLLFCAQRDLPESALLNIDAPNGIEPGKWHSILRKIAKERPFLWPNHRKAVTEGYLEPEVSSAISFPTGAGKSTLSELKIATALLRSKQVVFLAPTLALVDQTSRALEASFPDQEIFREQSLDLTLETDMVTLNPISVLTPERCLALLNFQPELFSDVGLVVFDECHLLHPREADKSRRSVDAMLCILNLRNSAPDADFLFLSAMMQNTSEIAEWLGELTGRKCLSLDLQWKPTRQVRGCVVYGQNEINALKATLKTARANSETKGPPVATQRKMVAEPFGFFCLHQKWQSKNRGDYSLIPLLEENVTLGTGKILPDDLAENPELAENTDYRWYLTPNGLQVSADLAEASAKRDLKTIVFVQTIPNAISTDKSVSKRLDADTLNLTDDEKQLLALVEEEVGGAAHTYLHLSKGSDHPANSSVCHHGHLLPLERRLHEAIFKRSDGVNVLVATSTLSQGMNLPSDIVLIGGDSRFDLEAEKMEQLEAHELLNAAGRAGRAGDRSHGFVLVVPSKVVHFNNETSTIHKYWTELQGIFSQSDQCVAIEDPLMPILDHIHAHSAADSPMSEYLLGRLQFSLDPASEEVEGVSVLLNKSFAAFQARKRNENQWMAERINALRAASVGRQKEDQWKEKLAASAGIPVEIVNQLAEKLNVELKFEAPTSDWFEWFSDWLANNPRHFLTLVRSETLENFMGTQFKRTASFDRRAQLASQKLSPLLSLWMKGEPLSKLEVEYGTKPHLIKTCEKAREFVLRIVPELAYIYGLPNLVFKAMKIHEGADTRSPVGLETLSACVRQGYDMVEKFALELNSVGQSTRRLIHQEYALIQGFVSPIDATDTLGAITGKIEVAKVIKDL